MRYFKLIDEINYNDIIKEDGGKSFEYEYGVEEWKITADLIEYLWPDGIYSNEYEIVSQDDANRIMNETREHLNCQLLLAQEIAKKIHLGQLDKGGNPYIEHPLTVAANLKNTEKK